MSHHRRTDTSFTPLKNRKNLDGGTLYYPKVGRVRDGFKSAQCYNGGGAVFIHHSSFVRLQPRGGSETNCVCIIQLGNPLSEKVYLWLDIQRAFAVQAFKK